MKKFRFFLFLLNLGIPAMVFSQGVNCSSAVPIIVNGACASGTISSTVNTIIASPTCLGANAFNREGWYSFTVTTGPVNITITGIGNNKNILLQAFSGVCTTLTPIGCANAVTTNGTQTETINLSSVANGTYFIRVLNVGTNGTMTLTSLCVNTPPVNDECSTATTLVSNASCVNTSGKITGATASSQTNGCFGTADDDVWYQFVATTTLHNISISNVVGTVTDLYHSVYAGTCASLGSALVCSDPDNSVVTGLTIGSTYYIRVFSYTSTPTQTATFDICVTGCTSFPLNDECVGAIALTMNPFGSCGSTSSGNVSCATASGTSLGACFGNPDDDIWYKFVATAGAHSITLTSGFDAYMQLFSGICGTLTSLQCSDPNTFTASGLTIGQTYFIRVFSYAAGAPANGSITLCVAEPPTCPANLGTGNITIASLPYSGTTETTCGAGNEITGSNASTCGSSSYFSDADKVYIFTPTSSGQITVSLNSTQTWTAATVYGGCPFSGTCVAYVQNSNSGLKSFCTSVVSGTTYYLVIDSYGTLGSCITAFSLSITAPSSGVANDLPCAATPLTIGVSISGDNSCTSGAGEPAGNPSCWTSGSKNTVWYSFVAPSSHH